MFRQRLWTILNQDFNNKTAVIGERSKRPTASTSPTVFANAVTEDYTVSDNIRNLCETVLSDIGGGRADLCIVFAGGPGHPDLSKVLPAVHEILSPNVLLGCSGSGVIGAGREIESGTGLSILAARCDTSSMRVFAFEDKHSNSKASSPEQLLQTLDINPDDHHGSPMLILIDPLTVATESALSTLDSAFPHTLKFGGLVGGGYEYGDNAMFIGDRILRKGAVGLLLGDGFAPELMVSSNEVPVGPALPISVANRNVIMRFEERGPDGITPLEVLRKLHADVPSRMRQLLSHTLIAGVEWDRTAYANNGEYDFVMRNIMGVDDDTGAMAVGDLVEEGQVFQFHVRDPLRAEPKLRESMDDIFAHHEETGPDAALCFNSVTRGTRLHDKPDHEIQIISSYLGGAPAAGFFSNGEIVSKIGGFLEDEFVTKVMGYTHTVALLGHADGTRH